MFAEAAERRPEFVTELPRFHAAIRQVFNHCELAGYVARQKPIGVKTIASIAVHELNVSKWGSLSRESTGESTDPLPVPFHAPIGFQHERDLVYQSGDTRKPLHIRFGRGRSANVYVIEAKAEYCPVRSEARFRHFCLFVRDRLQTASTSRPTAKERVEFHNELVHFHRRRAKRQRYMPLRFDQRQDESHGTTALDGLET
jgi:NAD(P)H-dependent flavin oxidoreductase YrpB (nitropropane dioxygenase family)